MGLPKHVGEVRKELEVNGDERLDIMKKLTDSTHYKNDCEKLWITLFKEHKSFSDVDTNLWVFSFLDAVAYADKPLVHFNLNDEDRIDAIKEIEIHTKELVKLYSHKELDLPVVSTDNSFFQWFSNYETLENGEIIEVKKSHFYFTELLEFFGRRAIEELNESSYRGNKTKDFRAHRFIDLLASRNIERYGYPLEEVVRISTLLIYDFEYCDDKDLSKRIGFSKKNKHF